MYAKFFTMPDGNTSFQKLFLFATDQIVYYEYTENNSYSGTFELRIAFKKEWVKALKINGVITIDDDWLWITDIKYNGKTIDLSGMDCKGFLSLRVAVPSDSGVTGTEGYDEAEGSTANCIKHYLDRNLIAPADSERKIPLIWQANTAGLERDSYMAKYESVENIVRTLCDNAGIGYSVVGRLAYSNFLFRLRAGTDRSANQSDRPRVIFCSDRGNVLSIEYEHDISNYFNSFYQEGYGRVRRSGEKNISGIALRETSVSVNTDSMSDVEAYVLCQVEENVETHTYDLNVANSSGYGEKYFLGDIVTVRDIYTSNYFRAVITCVTKTYSSGQRNIKITLGKQKPKLLNRIINNMINGTIQRR